MVQEEVNEGAVAGNGAAPEIEESAADAAQPAGKAPESPAPDAVPPAAPEVPAPEAETPAAEPTPEPDAPAEPLPDEPSLVRIVLQKLIGHIGIKAKIEVASQEDGSYYANIRTKHSNGLLIGRRGQTLRSIQYLTRLIVKQHYPEVPPIAVDVSGYRMRRENFLRKKATAVSRIVLETRREMALDLLTEKEMEVVQEALRTLAGIRVYAVGTGTKKNVIIAPTGE